MKYGFNSGVIQRGQVDLFQDEGVKKAGELSRFTSKYTFVNSDDEGIYGPKKPELVQAIAILMRELKMGEEDVISMFFSTHVFSVSWQIPLDCKPESLDKYKAEEEDDNKDNPFAFNNTAEIEAIIDKMSPKRS